MNRQPKQNLKVQIDVMPVRYFPDKNDGMSLPMPTADRTSLQTHTASPREVASFVQNSYEKALMMTG
jgi:hypothetical protein